MNFGKLLRAYRLAANISQSDLALKSGLSRNGISDLERGIRLHPHKETIDLIAETLKLSPPQRSALREAARRRPVPKSPTNRGQSTDTSPLLGRQKEQEQISGFLKHPRSGIFYLSGEPGIGKTRLLQAAIHEATELGWSIFFGACHRWSSSEVLSPIADAIAAEIDKLSVRDKNKLMEGFPSLRKLLPLELGVSGDSEPTDGQDLAEARRNLYSVIAQYLQASSGPAGTLLVLDDLQWAGEDTIKLLQFLLAQPQRLPLAIVCSFRSTDTNPESALMQLRVDTIRAGRAVHLELEPLDRESSERLVEGVLDLGATNQSTTSKSSLRMVICNLSHGNPYFLINYALSVDPDHPGKIPSSLSSVILQRFAGFPEPARTAISIVAVSPRSLPVSVVLAVMGPKLGEDRTLTGIEEALGQRILREDEEGNLRFHHDLLREAILSILSTTRQITIHQQLAIATESANPLAYEALAYHFERGQLYEKAAHYLQLGGKRSESLFSFVEATDYYRRALTALQSYREVDEPTPLHSDLIHALMMMNRHEEAIELLHSVIGLARGKNKGALQLSFETILLEILCREDRFEEAQKTGAAIEKRMSGASSSPEYVSFLIQFAYVQYLNSDFFSQGRLIELAEELAASLDDPKIASKVAEGKALMLNNTARFEEAAGLLGTAIQPGGQAEADDRGHVSATINFLANKYSIGNYEPSWFAESIEDVTNRARSLNDERLVLFATFLSVAFHFERGDWDNALRLGKDVLSHSSQRAAGMGFLPQILVIMAAIEQFRGRRMAADALVLQASPYPDAGSNWRLMPPAVQAEILLYGGRPDAAAAELSALDEPPWNNRPHLSDWKALLACSRSLSGVDKDETLRQASATVRAERDSGALPNLSECLRYRGWIYLHHSSADRDYLDRAHADLSEALEIDQKLERAYSLGKLHALMAQLAIRRNQRDLVVGHLEAAIGRFTALREIVCLDYLAREFSEAAFPVMRQLRASRSAGPGERG